MGDDITQANPLELVPLQAICVIVCGLQRLPIPTQDE